MNLRSIFTFRVLAWMMLLALGMTVGILGLLWYSRPNPLPIGVATAELNVIRVPTATPTPVNTPTPIIQTPTTGPPLEQGQIGIGGLVAVRGTGGSGLRVRENPGLSQGVRFLGEEGETFHVQDGPRELDGYIWWYLVSPKDAARLGWAVSDFLQAVPSP
jgi:hypothetical protein